MAGRNIVCALLSLFSLSKTIATRVELTIPVHQVTVGQILPIQCKIWDMEDNNRVKMVRVTADRTEELTLDLRYFSSSLEQRVFVTKRHMPDGTTVYFMTIVDISLLDQGDYFCLVYALSGIDSVKIAEGSTNVEIYTLPNSIYPLCDSTPAATEALDVNVQLRLSCISSKGIPAVTLRWMDNLNNEIAARSNTQDDTVSTEMLLWTTTSHHGKVFICEMTSTGFQDFKRTCQIGPITIKPVVNNEITAVIQPVVTQPTDQTLMISTDCNSKCTQENTYTVLYLSVSTITAAILCLVFLTTTIIWCYKYQTISNEIRDTQRGNVTICDGSEPVYVSLQARPELAIPGRRSIYQEPDRSSVYMSVEDPNNPGNKVIMPKEEFEEFYNSLSLKRV